MMAWGSILLIYIEASSLQIPDSNNRISSHSPGWLLDAGKSKPIPPPVEPGPYDPE
jgi:hypothetical protein